VAGTLQAGSHIVFGTGATNPGGVLTVTLTGSAAFTSGSSYQCTGTYQANAAGTAPLAINTTSATGFTMKGDSSKTVSFICVGN
jgi:FtsH-binding integral membrane protein